MPFSSLFEGLFIILFTCFLSYEGGHFLAALLFGHRLRFRFQRGRFGVPRMIWTMPVMDRRRQCLVAVAGFLFEFAVTAAMALCGCPLAFAVFCVHLCAYPYYAGADSDFSFLKGE